MQSSKTGGMGSGLAGNAALDTAFGGQGADQLLRKITIGLAVTFMLLGLYLSSAGTSSETSVSSDGIGQAKDE